MASRASRNAFRWSILLLPLAMVLVALRVLADEEPVVDVLPATVQRSAADRIEEPCLSFPSPETARPVRNATSVTAVAAVAPLAGTASSTPATPAPRSEDRARLDVEVRDATGAPVADALVRVSRPDHVRAVRTDGLGIAALEDLPEGLVQVHARTADAATSTRLVLLDPAFPARVLLTLAEAAVVRGRVVERETERPLAGVAVEVRETALPKAPVPAVRTDADGRFVAAGPFAPDTRVEVVATIGGYAEARAVLIASREAEPVVLTLWPERFLEGRVIDAAGRPVASAEVRWAGASAEDPSAVSDVRGRFRVPLPPAPAADGVYAIAASARGGRYGAAAVRLGTKDEPPVVIVRGTGTLSGRVRDTEGRPVADAQVTLTPSPAHVPGLAEGAEEAWARLRGLELRTAASTVASDADGAWRFAQVPAGAWFVRVVRGELEERLADPVLLVEGAEVTRDVMLGPMAPLFGRVVDVVGRGIAGARVLARPSGGHAPSGDGHATTSGDDGRYVFEPLRADVALDLLVSAPGFADRTLREVFPGVRALDVTLTEPVEAPPAPASSGG